VNVNALIDPNFSVRCGLANSEILTKSLPQLGHEHRCLELDAAPMRGRACSILV
jgi:hypothetical protein